MTGSVGGTVDAVWLLPLIDGVITDSVFPPPWPAVELTACAELLNTEECTSIINDCVDSRAKCAVAVLPAWGDPPMLVCTVLSSTFAFVLSYPCTSVLSPPCTNVLSLACANVLSRVCTDCVLFDAREVLTFTEGLGASDASEFSVKMKITGCCRASKHEKMEEQKCKKLKN